MHAFDFTELIPKVAGVTLLFVVTEIQGSSNQSGRKLKKGVRWEMGLSGRPKVNR